MAINLKKGSASASALAWAKLRAERAANDAFIAAIYSPTAGKETYLEASRLAEVAGIEWQKNSALKLSKMYA